MLLTAAMSARADEQADAKALLEKAIKAHGGGDNIAKVKAGTLATKGKFFGMGEGIDYTASIAFQGPDRQGVVVEFEAGGQKFKYSQIFNKDKGWIAINENVTEMGKESIQEMKETLHAQTVSRLNPATFKEAKLQTVGEIKVGDKPALGVRVEIKGYRDVTLFFDKETHLLVKSERRAKDVPNPGEEFGEETYYSDYKEVDGVKSPHRIIIKRDGKDFLDSETTEYQSAEKVDDSRFAKP
jgi:hypothetical protein